MNKPYDVLHLSPEDALLLGRMDAVETMLGGMAQVINNLFPSATQPLNTLLGQCAKSVQQAEEKAAALYLQELGALPIGDSTEHLPLKNLMDLSSDAAAELDDFLNIFLPKSGAATAYGNLLHPVALRISRLLERWGEPVELSADPEKVSETFFEATKKLALYKSALLHPGGQPETLFVLGNSANHALIIAPERLTWCVMTFPSANPDMPPFIHRQAKVLNLNKAVADMRAVLGDNQPPPIRALLRERENATTTIQVLLADIFQSPAMGEVTVNREGLFEVYAASGQQAQVKRIVVVRDASTNSGTFQYGFVPENTTQGFLLVGDQAVPSPIDDLQPQTKAILIEALTELAKKVKPPKAKKTIKSKK